MHLVTITTSVNYTDYLHYSLRTLAGVADQTVVVTAAHDSSIPLCQRVNASLLVYDGWQKDGATFNKAGAIRCAQEMVHATLPDSWYLLIDADVALPKDARSIIEAHVSDESCMYSAKRLDFHTMADFVDGKVTKVYESMFAGYFQLYRRHVLYPEWSRSAEGCDLTFAKQFDTCRMLPMSVYHLGQEHVNWEGRQSALWAE